MPEASWRLSSQLRCRISPSRSKSPHSSAGGGGFLLVYCPLERQERLEKGMRDYRAMPFRLEPDGSKVIFNYRRDMWK